MKKSILLISLIITSRFLIVAESPITRAVSRSTSGSDASTRSLGSASPLTPREMAAQRIRRLEAGRYSTGDTLKYPKQEEVCGVVTPDPLKGWGLDPIGGWEISKQNQDFSFRAAFFAVLGDCLRPKKQK